VLFVTIQYSNTVVLAVTRSGISLVCVEATSAPVLEMFSVQIVVWLTASDGVTQHARKFALLSSVAVADGLIVTRHWFPVCGIISPQAAGFDIGTPVFITRLHVGFVSVV
jgi:hypothetical protein